MQVLKQFIALGSRADTGRGRFQHGEFSGFQAFSLHRLTTGEPNAPRREGEVVAWESSPLLAAIIADAAAADNFPPDGQLDLLEEKRGTRLSGRRSRASSVWLGVAATLCVASRECQMCQLCDGRTNQSRRVLLFPPGDARTRLCLFASASYEMR